MIDISLDSIKITSPRRRLLNIDDSPRTINLFEILSH